LDDARGRRTSHTAGVDTVGVGAASRVRLTPRGRLVLVAVATVAASLVLALLTLGPVFAQGQSSAAEPGGAGVAPVSSTWVVQPGETLWVIAERIDPDTDPRETVARIVAMNDMPDSSVLVGQELQIPA
ncbi:MAG TPA: LysM peptidoglycan-binding domain-containing protein, partial [Actinomycetes bacterium]|nr:LysM peptidoglycan-binding domain-containing protein [Actinomycetes bacterium]